MTENLMPVATGHRHQAQVDLAELTGSGPDLPGQLAQLVRLTCAVVPGADAASVVLGHPLRPEQSTPSSPLAAGADTAQLTAGCGPAVDAYESALPVAGTLTADRRWPRLPESVAFVGVRAESCVAVPIRSRAGAEDGARTAVLGVCSIYGPPAAVLTPVVVEQAEHIAARTFSLVVTARRVAALMQEARRLRDEIGAHAAVAHVEGMIMADSGCTADTAYLLLRRLAAAGGRTVEEIAFDVLGAHARRRRERDELLREMPDVS